MANIERQTLTTEEAAKYLGISKDLLYKLCRQKGFPVIRLGRKLLFKNDHLERWMENQFIDSEDDPVSGYGTLRKIRG
jgi:excisionase family DNA binding protein